ncbi:MAG: hypothetical protein QNJ51_24035 [Calothrix sp. MO_167.B12]|nr:hypothetical protein [Calothrix sp. MO_167.B12]
MLFTPILIFCVGYKLDHNQQSPLGSLQPRQVETQSFEFSSGDAYHFEGFGKWKVTLRPTGAFSITHNIRGLEKDYGAFTLTEKENSDLWKLIRGSDIEKMQSSTRKGSPDEVQYTFKLTDKAQTVAVNVWGNEAIENKEILALIDQIGILIEKYTGEKSVLK